MSKELRKGENVAEARIRWRQEAKRKELREMERQRLAVRKERRRLKDLESGRKTLKKKVEEVILQKPAIPLPVVTPPPMEYFLSNKKLSVLICSITTRTRLLQNLMRILKEQATDDVEILVELDNGKMSIGAKRNKLLKKAIGDYIAFVDDDDKVSEDYTPKILEALSNNPDCCGVEGEITHTKRVRIKLSSRPNCYRRSQRCVQKFIHSIQYHDWFEKSGVYYRCPNHLNPVKREIALKVMFPDASRGEDKHYSFRLYPLLKTEEYIHGVIYFYRAS